jgi:hypothetical protein
MDVWGFFFSSFIGVLVFIMLLVVYFLPAIIAIARHHKNALAIFLLNFFLGGTFVGWVIALVWAVSK